MEKKTRITGIIIRDGKLLMVKGREHAELWTPGGTMQEGETDEKCLERELHEELGLEVVKMTFFKEYFGTSLYTPDRKIIQRVYITEISGIPTPAMEIGSYVWLSKKDIAETIYRFIPQTEKEIIPDLIRKSVWR